MARGQASGRVTHCLPGVPDLLPLNPNLSVDGPGRAGLGRGPGLLFSNLKAGLPLVVPAPRRRTPRLRGRGFARLAALCCAPRHL